MLSYLQNKESVKVLFGEVAEKIASRPGGYTRIIKLGNRLGDNADICIMELVDYNETMLKNKPAAKARTRRGRRGSKATVNAADTTPKTETAPATKPEATETNNAEDKVEE